MEVNSVITGGRTRCLFNAKVLGKHSVTYYQCVETGHIQTDAPYWLDEAYAAPITALDLGLLSRNINKSELTATVIERIMPASTRFLDFGGGYGIFTRLMRDRGYAFRHYDEFCENLFAKNFQVADWSEVGGGGIQLLTAWEVFEHIPTPVALVQQLFAASDVLLLSTELVPDQPLRDANDWWYFAPETGQHVSFFTKQSMGYLAKMFNCHFYTDGQSNHVLSQGRLESHPFSKSNKRFLRRLLSRVCRSRTSSTSNRTSLLQHDYKLALSRLRDCQLRE